MKTIKLERKNHRDNVCIFVRCERDSLFDKMIRNYPGSNWSKTERSWYIKDTPGSFRELTRHFRGCFKIDTTALHDGTKAHASPKYFDSEDTPSFNQAQPDVAQSVEKQRVKINSQVSGGSYDPVEMTVDYSNGRLLIKFLGRYDSEWIKELRQYGKPFFNPDTKEWSLFASRVTIDSLSDYFSTRGIELHFRRKKADPGLALRRKEEGKEIRSRILCSEAEEAISQIEAHLREKRYSKHTVSTYSSMLGFFLRYYNNKVPSGIDLNDISAFMEDYVIKLEYSASFQTQMITAIKTHYIISGGNAFDLDDIKRPRKGRSLPHVFSKEEITSILNSPRNIKHKLLLWIIYSCGLRRGEAINIRLEDINRERGTLFIRAGKGNNDRVVPLPPMIWSRIDEYLGSYEPVRYLFEGQRGGKYSAGSVYRVFRQAMSRAGIYKDVGVHSLRHSYATHLHESGLDIRYIQELLGHRSSRTTEIYTHVSRRHLAEIKSPIEDLDLH